LIQAITWFILSKCTCERYMCNLCELWTDQNSHFARINAHVQCTCERFMWTLICSHSPKHI